MAAVTFKVEKNYLVFPISPYVGTRTVKIVKDGNMLDDFTLRLDYVNPRYASYYSVAAYLGQEITMDVAPELAFTIEQTDTPDFACRDNYTFRPYIHFTAPYGWLNDPNGLVVYTSPVTGETTYHLFYQHNPYDYIWGNMHWGHAISRDLFHWEHLPHALSPDAGGTMFSGSAIVDYDNRSGLKTGDEDVILLFYTCAGNTSERSRGKKFTQCLAYSNDGGMTFTKYEKNPIVGHIAADNRDPKVIWCEELGKFVMALYLDGNEYALLTSDNFIDWTELQRIFIDGDAECPDFYPLTVRETGERKWVFSGASHHYMVGEFVDGKFSVNDKSKVLCYGDCSYAAQTYSWKNEARRVQIGWDRNTHYGSDPLCGQMSVPYELSLVQENGDYFLAASPVAEIEGLVTDTAVYDNLVLNADSGFSIPLDECAYRLELVYNRHGEDNIDFEIFGQHILLENSRDTLHIHGKTMPLSIEGNHVALTLIVDKGSVEIFGCGGKALLTTPWAVDFNLKRCVLRSSNAHIASLTVEKLAL